jgi:hypothetical protein
MSLNTLHASGKRKVDIGFRFKILKVKDHLEDLDVDGSKIRNMLFKQYNGRVLTDSSGFR